MTSVAPQAFVDLRFGDCLDVLRTLADCSIDAVVTDPPYGLADHKPGAVVSALTAWASGDREHVPNGRGFMGREWDGFVPPPAVWDECLRVLRPGGHMLVFAGSRTADLMGMSIRLAGFEIRDTIMWVYGSGMPHGINVGKAIDKIAGAERPVVGSRLGIPGVSKSGANLANGYARELEGRPDRPNPALDITAPATPEAARWEGWNTALKPAQEPIIVARKPLTGTVAQTVMEHGTGAINVDACRVQSDGSHKRPPIVRRAAVSGDERQGSTAGMHQAGASFTPTNHDGGRWPANVVLVHAESCRPPAVCDGSCAVAEMDRQGGHSKSNVRKPTGRDTRGVPNGDNMQWRCQDTTERWHNDQGGASRFFPSFRYQAKAPSSERPRIDGKGWPTVKPRSLMAWLARLVCPPGGVVLDPFAGTGPTLQASRDEGFASIGIERDAFAYRLARKRLGLPELVEQGSACAQLGGLRAVARVGPILAA